MGKLYEESYTYTTHVRFHFLKEKGFAHHAAHKAAKGERKKIIQIRSNAELCLRQASYLSTFWEKTSYHLWFSIVSLWLTSHIAKGTTTVQVPLPKAFQGCRPIPLDSQQLGWWFHNVSHFLSSCPPPVVFGTSNCVSTQSSAVWCCSWCRMVRFSHESP